MKDMFDHRMAMLLARCLMCSLSVWTDETKVRMAREEVVHRRGVGIGCHYVVGRIVSSSRERP